MTVKDVVAMLQYKKQNNVPSRFPCRIILVKDIAQYCSALSELKKISDIRVIKSEEIVKGRDVFPAYSSLNREGYVDKWLILTGVGEYLRLFLQYDVKEKKFADLWKIMFSGTSSGRIIIPLWGFDMQQMETLLHLKNSRQEDFCFDCTDCSLHEQKINMSVYSDEFGSSVPISGNVRLFTGLREMFEYWENPSPSITNFVLVTKQYGKIAKISGDINIQVTGERLEYLSEHMRGGEYLTEENCSSQMQETLFSYALKGCSLDGALLEIFNVSSFSGKDIMGKWNTMPPDSKNFLLLWYKLHPDTSYLNHCINVSPSVEEITFTVSHEIFNVMEDKPAWIDEFKQLVSVMNIKPDAKYFSALDGIADYESRLEFLTDDTKEERIYMLKMAGKCCAEGSKTVIDKIKDIYPALALYLTDDYGVYQAEIGAYMLRYKTHKLANTLPDNEESFFEGVNTGLFDKRYSVLHKYEDDSTVFLWIDALGAEWLPLLYSSLVNNCDASVKCEGLVQANLPTETCYNNQWESISGVKNYKLDKLDKLAHKGVVDDPNYYSCIEEQIEFVSAVIGKKVTELLETYRRVVVTGDHGTSRLAARFFHCREGSTAPKDATVCSFGRYCKLQQDNMPHQKDVIICNSQEGKFAVFSNYDHFKQSGNASGSTGEDVIYGEVHGGATPEEMLVPVIVVESNKPAALSGSWEQTSVKILSKKAKFTIVFNRKVQNLRVKIQGADGIVTGADNGIKWEVVFYGVKAGDYHVEVYADGHILNMPDITLRPALGGGDGDLL